MPDLKSSFAGHLLNTVITTIATLGVAWTTMLSGVQTSEDNRLAQAFNRIEGLEARIDVLNNEIRVLEVKNALLRAAVDSDIDVESALIALLTDMDTPAWFKRYDNGEFRMVFINAAHETTYGIDNNAYAGVTDFDVWPAEVAAFFTAQDQRVYDKKDFQYVVEPVVDRRGREFEVLSVKFYHQSSEGHEYIFGVQLDAPSYLERPTKVTGNGKREATQ